MALKKSLLMIRGAEEIPNKNKLKSDNVQLVIQREIIYSSKKVLHHSLLFLCILNFQYL